MLQSTKGRMRGLLASLAAIFALAALTASPAAAEEVAGIFSGSTVKLTTSSVTVKRNGTEAKTCTLLGGSTVGVVSGSGALIKNTSPIYLTRFNCTGSTVLDTWTNVTAVYDTEAGKYFLDIPMWEWELQSPWGTEYISAPVRVPWTNGSGGTNSTVTYSETVIGEDGYGPITMSGTFTATTNDGKLLTLSH